MNTILARADTQGRVQPRWINGHRYAWDPEKHPRHERGSERGGEFAPKGALPETDEDVTEEVMSRLPPEARTPEGAERVFLDRLRQLAGPKGVVMYHESPGDVKTSMLRDGIRSDYGIFATVGEPSRFVTSDTKTVVKFVVPHSFISSDNIVPDMRYGGLSKLSPHQALLLQSPDVKGADVSISAWERLPTKLILAVKVVKKGQSGYYVLAYADTAGRVHRAEAQDDRPPLTDAQFAALLKRYAGWEEEKHPRQPSGSEKGGEFAPVEGEDYEKALKEFDALPPGAQVQFDPWAEKTVAQLAWWVRHELDLHQEGERYKRLTKSQERKLLAWLDKWKPDYAAAYRRGG